MLPSLVLRSELLEGASHARCWIMCNRARASQPLAHFLAVCSISDLFLIRGTPMVPEGSGNQGNG